MNYSLRNCWPTFVKCICLYSSLLSCEICIHFITSSINNIKILCICIYVRHFFCIQCQRIQMKACLLWIICCGIVMESSSHTSVRHTQTCRTPVHTQLGEVEQSLPGCVLRNNVCCSLFPVPSLFCLSDCGLYSVQGNYVVRFCQIQCPVSGVPVKHPKVMHNRYDSSIILIFVAIVLDVDLTKHFLKDVLKGLEV